MKFLFIIVLVLLILFLNKTKEDNKEFNSSPKNLNYSFIN